MFKQLSNSKQIWGEKLNNAVKIIKSNLMYVVNIKDGNECCV